MSHSISEFDEKHVLEELRHYLPAQAPLKDFIHHNTLHAFQSQSFFKGIFQASNIFGYKVTLSIEEYRTLFAQEKINPVILQYIIDNQKDTSITLEYLLHENISQHKQAQVGKLRSLWKSRKIDIDALVHVQIFRIVNSYLDQGISIWNFPISKKGFLDSIRQIEKNSFTSFFKTKRAKELLLDESTSIHDLLKIIVGREEFFTNYIFDQQFAHPGWSGLISVLESNPKALLDQRSISIQDWILLELLFEIDIIEYYFKNRWISLANFLEGIEPTNLFEEKNSTKEDQAIALWQQAFEWTYYDRVLTGIKQKPAPSNEPTKKAVFQAIFCIDDRECSLRRNIEAIDTSIQTFGTPGHFNLEFYYQPEHGKFSTKVCPAPITPKYLIKEYNTQKKYERDIHFEKRSHHLLTGALISQTIGFWSGIKLFINIFKPSLSPASAFSFQHMHRESNLTFEHQSSTQPIDGLQIGFTIAEMAHRLEAVLKSIGLVEEFAPLVYIMGHGASSVNNTHYAGYDCGACSGRPGSVNARVFSAMANHPNVRELLAIKGIDIPKETQFLGGLHDTTRDEFVFYDTDILSYENYQKHLENETVFNRAMMLNAKERSRRFVSINTKLSLEKIHQKIKERSVSLFEPRPELNHATNTLCIIGRRSLTNHLFLDRRAFLNSYDYKQDPTGQFLLNILNAAAPVCGGINLEYYFSRVDNEKLGAGTKLPHNVMGLNGVANGIEGDLRPGLPLQMIELHDPMRLLMIVEHYPDIVHSVIEKNSATFEWFKNDWIHLVCIHPENNKQYLFKNQSFEEYHPFTKSVPIIENLEQMIEEYSDSIPVGQIKK